MSHSLARGVAPPQAVDAFAARDDARWVVCSGSKTLFASETALALLRRSDALEFSPSLDTQVFLGTLQSDGAPLFAIEATARADDPRFADTRTQAPFLSFTENQAALTSAALLTWHTNSRFCSKCGGAQTVTQAGHCMRCSACAAVTFPRTDPAVIVAVSSRCNNKILLARSPRHPEKMMTTLAGFVEAGETFEDAVAREIEEESGVRVDSVSYLKSQPWPFPQSSMIAFRATADADAPLNIDDDELVEAKWWDRAAVRKACTVPGAVMRPDVAAAALAKDPSLELLIPPKQVVARELIEQWLQEDPAE